jgi:hypothetical protein
MVRLVVKEPLLEWDAILMITGQSGPQCPLENIYPDESRNFENSQKL